MYTLIRYSFGAIVEGVVLTMGRDQMRIAAAGFVDTLVLKRLDSRWFTEGGHRVELEFLLGGAPVAEDVPSEPAALGTLTAGAAGR
jgi:hypothetical protein